jgi:hypothetical protein
MELFSGGKAAQKNRGYNPLKNEKNKEFGGSSKK